MRKLIAVMCCERLYARVEAIQETWAQDMPKDGTLDLRFFFGRGYRHGCTFQRPDEITLDVEESYAALPDKVQAMLQWSVQQGYDYTFKTDDDVYVSPAVLARCTTAPHDYIGRFRGPSGGYPADYASGYGYWLSQKAARIVAESPRNKDWAEDRWVGNLLAVKRVQAWRDDASYAAVAPYLMPQAICEGNVSKQAAAFCEFSDPKVMREMHKFYKQLVNPRFFLPGVLRAVNQYTTTDADYFREPTDTPDWNKQERSVAAVVAPALKVCPTCHGSGTVK